MVVEWYRQNFSYIPGAGGGAAPGGGYGLAEAIADAHQFSMARQGRRLEDYELQQLQAGFSGPLTRDRVLEYLEGIAARGGIRAMAEGGAGVVRRPTLFLAGEAGPEEYAFSGAHRSFRPGGSDAAVASLQTTFREEMSDLRRAMQTTFVTAVENASRHGAQTAGRRR
jgi:hypothetical protein